MANTDSTDKTQEAISGAVSFAGVETPILDALKNYLNNPTIPLHIPGHAKGEGVLPDFRDVFGQKILEIDTTDEFNGLGKLHPAEGPVAKAQELAAEAFGSEKAFFLINGSTVGNLALALSVAKENKKIIIGRNCHRSIISGLTLTGAEPVWAIPEKLDKWGVWGSITAETIETLLDQNPDATAVWINNPTYEGIVSDVESIAKVCKKRNVIFIVDEAHGCLWKFSDKFPKPALECGADAVVHSLHKTGGSFSQSSILHIAKNSKINHEEIEANLSMLHSTSPSYMMLASLDAARAYLTSDYGQERIQKAIKNAEETRKILSSIKGVQCLTEKDGVQVDLTKIYLKIDGLCGKRLESILEFEYGITVEAATDEGVLALSNIGNTAEELYSFCDAIKQIATRNYSDITYLEHVKYMPLNVPEIVCSPRKAFVSEKERIATEDSIGRVSAEVVAICPPGLPVLVPGEKITEEHLPFLSKNHTIQVMK
jgi:lysine decarboxylase